MNWAAPPMWSGGTAFIIGGGPSMPRQFGVPEDVVAKVMTGELPPSAYSPYLAPIHGAHVIGVNNAYQIGPWIDCIFFGDWPWYLSHRTRLAKFPNLKVSCPRVSRFEEARRDNIKVLSRGGGRGIAGHPCKLFGIADNPSKVAWNHNSGGAAISLAVHFGVKRIILLGFDMHHEGTKTHWHGGHGNKPRKSYERHLLGFPAIAEDAQRLGVEVLNCSPDSQIEAFLKVSLAEVFEEV